MEKFIALSVSNLRLDDLAGLATETFAIANPRTAALGDVGAAKLTVMDTATQVFTKLLNRNRASELTPQIAELDKQRDAMFNEIKRTVKTAQKSSTPATAAAGNTLMEVLHPFWHIDTEPLASQIEQTRLFLSRCGGAETIAALTTLGIINLMGPLTLANGRLKTLYNERLDEMSALEGPSATSAAKDVVAAYDDFCTAVEITLSALPTETLQLVFDDMNGIRRKYISKVPTPLTDKRTSTAPIPDQVRTGRHLTPLPRVFYQPAEGELRELVFAEDFTVSYRNNVEIGEAKLFVHGKGKYTGTYDTTFHIIENNEQ
jgi:hypothetical protein